MGTLLSIEFKTFGCDSQIGIIQQVSIKLHS